MTEQVKHIALIGFMGCGKTMVGIKLAQQLQLNHIDTDKVIEIMEGRSIMRIFEEDGEDYFRKLESELLAEAVAAADQLVISTGGGAILLAKNRELLKQTVVFYLQVSPEVIYERVKNDTSRPLLAGDNDLLARIRGILAEREQLYLEVADKVISADNKRISDIIDEIRRQI